MPSLKALNVSASLTVGSLDATICDSIQTRMGKSWQQEADRIESELRNAPKLPEQVIAGTNKVQYLGDNGDMPFLMVEAGKGVSVDPGLREYTASPVLARDGGGGDGTGNGDFDVPRLRR